MKSAILVCLAAISSFAYAPSAIASTLYASSASPPLAGGGHLFYSIDQGTAASTTISANTFSDDLASDWRPESYRIWAIYGNELLKVDPATGTETFLTFTSESIGAIAFDVTTNTLFGVGVGRGNFLCRIDPTTGAVTVIGNTSFGGYTGLAADLNGNLFAVNAANTLIRLDPITGHGQAVGTVDSGIEDLAVRPEDGTMFGIRNLTVASKAAYSLFTIDTAAGATAIVNAPQLNQTMSGLAFSPAVPEPSAVLLAAIMSTLICLRRSRCRGENRIAIMLLSECAKRGIRKSLPVGFSTSLVLALLLSVSTVRTVQADGGLQTIALSGRVAPGTSVSFESFSIPAISGGHAAFTASLTGAGVDSSNRNGVWSHADGAGTTLIARAGTTDPNAGGDAFIDFDQPVINSAGQIAFTGYLANNGPGVWRYSNGALSIVAKRSDIAPDSGGNFSVFSRWPAMNSSAQLAIANSFAVFQAGVPTSAYGIWFIPQPGDIQTRMLSGAAAPEAGQGIVFAAPLPLASPQLDDAGHIAFWAYLTGSGVNGNNNEGIWQENANGLHLIMREGQPAPGTDAGVHFAGREGNLAYTAIDAVGDIAFLDNLSGTGVTTSNSQGIWAQTSGNPLQLVARAGNLAPGTNVKFLQFGDPLMNAQGRIAFISLYLTGPSQTSSGVWSEGHGTALKLVAHGGDPAPGTSALFSGIYSNSLVINALGQTAFIGGLTGLTVNSTNDVGIWAEDLNGVLRKIVREGDFIDVDDGPGVDLRQVASFYFQGQSGNEDGRRSGFNDFGQVVFTAFFTDGTQGVFISNLVYVPEPTAVALAALGFAFVCLLHRRHRFLPTSSGAAATRRGECV